MDGFSYIQKYLEGVFMSLSAIILSLLTVFSVGTKTEIYTKPCTVEVVEEWVEVSDDNGNGWVFENSGIYDVGDKCVMIVDDLGTPENEFDDVILAVVNENGNKNKIIVEIFDVLDCYEVEV